MKKILALVLTLVLIMGAVGTAMAAGKVGISMPTKSLQRWNEDGSYLETKFQEAGYEVELQYAGDNDVPTQIAQLETMLLNGCDVLVITAIEATALGTVLATAKDLGVKVVCHDRIIMDTPAVDYYATFDNFQVGEIQGQYVVDTLGLAEGKGPYNIEFLAGDPGDNNATYFFNGAMSKVQEYLDNGQLICVSGQTAFDQVATRLGKPRPPRPVWTISLRPTIPMAPRWTWFSAPTTPPPRAQPTHWSPQALKPAKAIPSSPVRTATLPA